MVCVKISIEPRVQFILHCACSQSGAAQTQLIVTWMMIAVITTELLADGCWTTIDPQGA